MSGESALRATPSVNIEEFERRLRATGSLGAAHDDPLAELARLLGAEEPPPPKPAEAPVAVSEPQPEPEPELAPEAPPAPPPLRAAPRVESSFGRVVNVDFGAGHAPVPPPAEPPPLVVEPPPFLEPVAEPPPLLRAPSVARLVDNGARPGRKLWPVAALVVIGVTAGAGAWAYRGGVPGLAAKTPPLIMAAAGPIKVQPPSQDTVASPNDITSMIAKDQASRPAASNVVSNEEQPVDLNERAKAQAAADARAAAPPANPPTIAAAPLVVVAAPSPAAASAPAPASTNPNAATSSPTGDAQPAPSLPPAVSAPSPASQSPTRSLGLAAATPSPVAPADSTPIAPAGGTVGPTAAPPAPPTPFPEPKRVKTVSVRPDGSFIAPATAPAAQPEPVSSASQPLEPPNLPADPPIPVPRPTIDAAAAEPATPKLDLPTKLSGKSTTRVPIAKIDTTAATTGQSPESPVQASTASQETKPKRHEAPTHVAATDPPSAAVQAPPPAADAAPSPEEKPSGPASLFAALGDAARGIAGRGQDNASAAAAPQRQTASAAPTATATAPAEGGGNYAVQLAAPQSAAEAQSVAGRLQAKYAGELGGMQPVIRKADIKDKTVYRVRIPNLTRSAAVSLCEKLKAAGGACFLARE